MTDNKSDTKIEQKDVSSYSLNIDTNSEKDRITGRIIFKNAEKTFVTLEKIKTSLFVYFGSIKNHGNSAMTITKDSGIKSLIKSFKYVADGTKEEVSVAFNLLGITLKNKNNRDYQLMVTQKDQEISFEYSKEELKAIIHMMEVVVSQKI